MAIQMSCNWTLYHWLNQKQGKVRVQAMSLNRADLLWMANTYVETLKLPSRLGYEITGGLSDRSFPVVIDREFPGIEYSQQWN